MPFSSFDHLISRTSRGFAKRIDFNYQFGVASAGTLGRWYDLSALNRLGPQNDWAGTALNWVTCNQSAGNGSRIFGIQHGPDVSPATKHVINGAAIASAAAGTGILQLVDIQGYWPGISTASASTQNLTGTPTLRYTNGVGCQLYLVTTTASGATAHNVAISYTNSGGTPGQSLRSTVSMTASAIVNHIPHSGTAANNAGPWLPLAAGDVGVSNVASVTMSASSGSGAAALVLARPICSIPMSVALTLTERDLIAAVPSLPRVLDNACLSWIYYSYGAVAANHAWYGHIDFAWA